MKMTIAEAERIIGTVRDALLEKSQHDFHPISLLKGYGVFQIDVACKLCIANEFLILSKKSDCEDKFAELINVYEGIPLLVETLFVPDDELEKLKKLPLGSPEYRKQKIVISPTPLDDSMSFKDERLASLETCSSFGTYCKCVSSKDPFYWQKIHSRIGIEYTSASPRGNTPA